MNAKLNDSGDISHSFGTLLWRDFTFDLRDTAVMRSLTLSVLLVAACQPAPPTQQETLTDVTAKVIEPSGNQKVAMSDPSYVSMMLTYDDKPVDLQASVVPVWSKQALYRMVPGAGSEPVSFLIDDTTAGSLSLYVEGMSVEDLKQELASIQIRRVSDGRLVEGLEWIVSPETESTQALLPYRGTQLAAVASASFGDRLKGQEAVYALNVGTGLQSKSVLLALNQPESAYELGLAPDRWLYHPSDQITLSAELREAGAAMRVVSARAFLSLSDGGLSAQADVQATERGGIFEFTLPTDATEGRWDLTVEMVFEGPEGLFHRTGRTEVEVVRPHARINDAAIRVDPLYGTGAAEVLIDVETKSPDRFSVYGTLTGYTDSGYEVPIAWARADATLDAGDREVMSLYFSVDDVVHAPVSGPYRLRNLILASMYRGTIQERRAWTGLETPEEWGLSMNRRLNRAMCLVLADAGHLPRAECPSEAPGGN